MRNVTQRHATMPSRNAVATRVFGTFCEGLNGSEGRARDAARGPEGSSGRIRAVRPQAPGFAPIPPAAGAHGGVGYFYYNSRGDL